MRCLPSSDDLNSVEVKSWGYLVSPVVYRAWWDELGYNEDFRSIGIFFGQHWLCRCCCDTGTMGKWPRAFCFILAENTDNSARVQPFDLTEVKAPDGSISAKFVSLGATLTELWVKDKNGQARDVVLGYDDNVCRLLVTLLSLVVEFLVAV